MEDKRTGAPYFVARVELETGDDRETDRAALQAGMRAEILLVTGQRTLLDQILDPVMRNLNRVFHG